MKVTESRARTHTGSHAHFAGASTRFVLIFDIWHPDFSPDEVGMQQRSQFNRPLAHVTSECHMSPANVTCHQHLSHVISTCHMSSALVTCRQHMSHVISTCHMSPAHVTYHQLLSHVTSTCHMSSALVTRLDQVRFIDTLYKARFRCHCCGHQSNPFKLHAQG